MYCCARCYINKKYAPPKEQCSLPNSRAAKVTGKNKTNLSFARPSSPAILKPLGLLHTHVVVRGHICGNIGKHTVYASIITLDLCVHICSSLRTIPAYRILSTL